MNLKEAFVNTIKAFGKYYKVAKTYGEKEKQLAVEYLKWSKKKTEIICAEKTFQSPQNVTIKRGDVFWFDFGYNIDQELGGRHPGLILRKGGRMVIVIPVSSKEPSADQINSGSYVEIDRIYNFKPMQRWVNILNTMPVSIQRIDFTSNKGNVKGYILDRIAAAANCIKYF